MVSLNDLRSAAVSLDWHEAVAAGAALAALVVDGRAPACPRPADVTLLPSGDLRLTGPGHLDVPPAGGVAEYLAQLLDATPCPAELRQLIDTYAADARNGADGVAAVEELLTALAFFERPGRREVLAAVELRAAPALERAQRSAALDALTERTRLAAGGTPVAAPPLPQPAVSTSAEIVSAAEEAAQGWDPPHDSSLRRLILPAAVGLAAFLAVAYVATAWMDRSPAASPGTEAADEELPISGAVPPEPTVQPPAAAPIAPAVRSPRSTTPSRTEGTPASPAVAASGAAADPPAAAPRPPAPKTVDVVVAERDGRVVSPPIAPVQPAPRATGTGRVFQTGDPQVTPAVLIRPRLPDQPPADVPAEQIGTLEFIVAETGAVEHVHLVSPTNRFQERMLVAAAKAWQFQPATREGRPVRFRTRIRVTL